HPAAPAVEDEQVDAAVDGQPGARRADHSAAADEQHRKTGPRRAGAALRLGHAPHPRQRNVLWRPAPDCFAGCPAEPAVTMTWSPTCGETRDARGAGPVGSARRAEYAQPGGTRAGRPRARLRPARTRVARGSAAATRAAARGASLLAVQRRPVTQALGSP